MAALDLERFKLHGRRFADGFTPGQKVLSVLGVIAVLGAGYLFMQWENTANWAPLYTGLDPSEASEITAELDAKNIDYKLEDGGQTIMVADTDVYQTRIDLSAEGLPSGGHESYALLDEGGITKDEFSKRVDYQRALQGELARTIESIDGVQAASVTLTIPPETVFVGGEAEKPTAAVLVKTGSTLNGETVEAIVHLVSSSVADMDSDSVTVADSSGAVLAAPGRGGSAGAGQHIEQTNAFEDDLARSVNTLIAASLGPGHSAVTAQAQLDFSDTKTVTKEFTQPNNIEVPISKQVETETFNGPGQGSTGILGPDGQPLLDGSGQSATSYEKSVVKQDNALNQVEATVNRAPGSVQQVSVSVLLDAEAVAADDVAQWETAISAAAGISVDRADVIAVTRVPFDEEAQEEADKALAAAESARSSNAMADMLRSIVTLLIVGLVLFFAWRAIKKAEANRIPMRVPIDLRELEAAERALEVDALAEARLLELERSGRSPSALSGSPGASVEAEISSLIERQPDEVAQTLRSWLADRRG